MSSLERDILLERYRMGEEDLYDTVVELFDQALKLELYSHRHNKPLKKPTKSKFTPC